MYPTVHGRVYRTRKVKTRVPLCIQLNYLSMKRIQYTGGGAGLFLAFSNLTIFSVFTHESHA